MNSNKKSLIKSALAFVCTIALCMSIPVATVPMSAAAEPNTVVSAHAETTAKGYYYDNLTIAGKEYELGKKFYDALESMRASGDFKDGQIQRSIDDIVTSDQLKAWVEDGDLTVPKAFGAARDSFLMDHPGRQVHGLYRQRQGSQHLSRQRI